MPTTVKKRSVVVSGHRTSISLERAFWEALREIAAQRDLTINQLVSEIDAARSGNLSSAIRVFILKHVTEAAERALGATPDPTLRAIGRSADGGDGAHTGLPPPD